MILKHTLWFFSFLIFYYRIENVTGLDPRIVGGRPALPNEFPYHVSLTWIPGYDYYCAGVLITPKFVLTAAHCVVMDYGWEVTPDYVAVIAGRYMLNQTGVVRNVKNITHHEDYVIDTKQNDIALIELVEPFELSESIQTIPLIEYRVPPKTKCTVAGFGALRHGGEPTSNRMMAVDVPVQSKMRCKFLFWERVTIYDGMMCAGYNTGGRDACDGDSGGPFVYKNQLVAVVSAGIDCGKLYNPGIYSDVDYFRPWINAHIQGVQSYPSELDRRIGRDEDYDIPKTEVEDLL